MVNYSNISGSQADMARSAKMIVEFCADVKEGEKIVVASDDAQSPNVYQSIFNAAHCSGADASLLVFPTPEWNVVGEWVKTPQSLLSIAKSSDCVIYCGVRHLSRDFYDVFESKEGKSRLLMVQGMSEESIIRTMPIDYANSSSESDKLIELLNRSQKVEVTSPNGTNIVADISDSSSAMARGTFKISTDGQPHGGKIEFLPAGRIGTFFVNVPINGSIIIDGFLGLGLCNGTVELKVVEGRVSEVIGSEGAEQWYLESLRKLFKLDENANHVGEIGIGLHPKARLVGSYEDYGVRGSIRFGFGNSWSKSGKKVASVLHSDCFVMGGTMRIDGKTIISNGEIIA